MLIKIFSILDLKADTFMPPFHFSTTGQAVRAFKDLVNDQNSTVYRHPEDYRLFCIGTLDDSTGRVTALEQLEPLGFATDYKALGETPVGVSPSLMPSGVRRVS